MYACLLASPQWLSFEGKGQLVSHELKLSKNMQQTCSPVFGRSVNPISTGGAHYAHHISTWPTQPGFSELETALHWLRRQIHALI